MARDGIKLRRMARIGNVLAVAMPQGTQVFDPVTGAYLGVVSDRNPVINGQTCYLSDNDYDAAKRALPTPDQIKH